MNTGFDINTICQMQKTRALAYETARYWQNEHRLSDHRYDKDTAILWQRIASKEHLNLIDAS